jgi:hypothetical protein
MLRRNVNKKHQEKMLKKCENGQEVPWNNFFLNAQMFYATRCNVTKMYETDANAHQ